MRGTLVSFSSENIVNFTFDILTIRKQLSDTEAPQNIY